MKILFIGAVDFSAHALRKLINMQANMVGVCTLRHSNFNADHYDLTPIARDANIPSRFTPDINDENVIQWIRERDPDVIFCFGWSRLIRKPLLKIPKLGVIGFHPTALPENRGRHPLIWPLVLGLKKTASTFFFMDEGADSGDILSQIEVPIDDADDAGTLYSKITNMAIKQIEDFVPRLTAGGVCRMPQDARLANTWRKRGPLDSRIDWRMSAYAIHNLVRGLTRPYWGAHFDHKGQSITVWRTLVETSCPVNLEPGKILRVDGMDVVVKTGDCAIRLLNYEPKIPLTAGGYL
jgi:methionyl-tRNA formyltransferase